MTDAKTIVQRLIARKYPNAGRYLFEEHELVQIVEAIQHDAAPPAVKTPRADVVGIHERCSRDDSDDKDGSDLTVRSVAGEWAHLECSACALEVSLRLPQLVAAAAIAATSPKGRS